MYLSSAIGALGLVAPVVLAAPSPPLVEKRACTFDSLTNPTCWDGTFDLNTNYYDSWPSVGGHQEYTFHITNITMAPDGINRTVLAINGQVPGPTIFANWGDTVAVTVINELEDAGTSIHFHGVRQKDTNTQDGAVSITQCPIPGGKTSMTYKWTATQYGTSWYHGHYGLQAWDGLFGPIVIAGPASSAYKNDLGTLMLSDWTHKTAEYLESDAAVNGGENIDNGLINGTNIFIDPTTNIQTGKRFEFVFQPNESHRIRLINTAMDQHFKVALDGHEMEVIAADFVPIKPFKTKILNIGIGQRYDVIITADQTPGNFWLRANVQTNCGQRAATFTDIRAIVRYNSPGVNGTADPPEATPPAFDVDCTDMPMANLEPFVAINLNITGNLTFDQTITFNQDFNNPNPVINWEIKDGIHFLSHWENPTLLQLAGPGNVTFPDEQQVLEVNGVDKMQFVLIQTDSGGDHPIHLHGHDFWIVDQSNTTKFDPSTFVPNTINPPRRDVALLNGSGHLVIAFKADNPGAWLLHCHIAWHVNRGMALTFLENRADIFKPGDSDAVGKNCDAWKAFAKDKGIIQTDTGV
ncbi:multicopper oxidase [Lasiosphaeria ovina]|uniref:Multicopper oxidase n=1 Tax=Lasiosphaeria ovina TaxID=92902 RepID=A0AAE0KG55_9PEZI|nr:multicopper oxidase [Lasiosphaeria ovina]